MKGTLSSSIQENHQFFSEDPFLLSIGLASFTKTSCSIIYNKNSKYFQNLGLPNTIQDNTTIIDLIGVDGLYTKFNVGAQQFEVTQTRKTIGEIYELIRKHEDIQFGTANYTQGQIDTYYDDISDINNSLEKCVEFRGPLGGGSNSNPSIVTIKLFFYNKSDRSNKRNIAIKDAINIAAIPSTPFGQKFSFSQTSSHQKSNRSNYGSLIPQSRPNENYKSNFSQDSVAAPLQTFYDSSTNTFKSGNSQILARLLTDVEPAPIESLEGADFDNIDDLLLRLSPFTTGKALPLSIEQGNPHLFGPNFVECLVKNKVEIDVVNRASRFFKKDTLVILTEINGEWIIQDFGESEEYSSPVIIQDWSFFKYIANSDSYFKDARHYDTPEGDNRYAFHVSPESYEEQSRLKFYNNILSVWNNRSSFVQNNIERPALASIYGSDLQRIIRLNTDNRQADFVPSTKFYIGSIFDQIGQSTCGFSDITIIHGVNASDALNYPPEQSPPDVFLSPAFNFQTFWGICYPNGFKTFTYNTIGRDNLDGTFFSPTFVPTNLSPVRVFPPYFWGEENLRDETFLLNMPSECAGIFINPLSIFQGWNNLGTQNFVINNQFIHSPFYGSSEPITKNSLQFSPLYATMVMEPVRAFLESIEGRFPINDYVPTHDVFIPNFNLDLSRSIIRLRTKFSYGVGPSSSRSFWGQLFVRSARFGFGDVYDSGPTSPSIRSEGYLGQIGMTYNSDYPRLKRDPITTNGEAINVVEPWKSTGFRSAPREGISPYCVGVLSAKTTISKRGGTNLIFSTNGVFGRANGFKRQVADLGTFAPIAIVAPTVGAIIPGISTGATFTTVPIPGWGSSRDDVGSFGTSALHARIFDYWPEDQTVFDPRYFAVLHFNPGSYYNDQTLSNINGETEEQLFKRLENAKTVDFPIPTLKNGNILVSGTVDRNTNLDIKRNWKLNPIRRGVLVSGGGFKYLRHVIGVNNSTRSIVYGGTGFTGNFDYTIESQNFSLNFKIQGGSIVDWTFNTDDLDNLLIGENFTQQDFDVNTPIVDEEGDVIDSDRNNKGLIITIKSPTNGKSAIIKFTNGIIWKKIEKDEGPKGGNVTRLTPANARGTKGVIEFSQETNVELSNNRSGKYDIFLHFHNDIGITLPAEYDNFGREIRGAPHKYTTLTIT